MKTNLVFKSSESTFINYFDETLLSHKQPGSIDIKSSNALIYFFKNRVHTLLADYYPENHLLHKPLQRALFYSRRRLRATLAYCGSGIVGGIPERSDRIAMAYEIITANYVLLDDSIILDSGEVRADMPTPRIEYGEVPALLAAATLQLEPIILLPENNLIKKIFYQSSNQTVVGWTLEDNLAKLPADTVIEENEILHTCRLLTGPLLAGALTSGAINSRGDTNHINALHAYAMDFGCAYQLTDHIVDLMEISEKSGKDNFSDIETNKKNIVINHALQTLPPSSKVRNKIIDVIGKTPSPEEKKELQEIFQKSGSIEYCLQIIRNLSEQAISHLQTLPNNKYRKLLEDLPFMYIDQLLEAIDCNAVE